MQTELVERLSGKAAGLCLELERMSQSGTDVADILDWAGDLLGFLGNVPAEVHTPQREAFVALQGSLVALRQTAKAASQEVLEREGWGNSEWALDELHRITGEAWRDEADDPRHIVRAATEALARPDLSEEQLHRTFDGADARCGYMVLFDAVQSIRREGPSGLPSLRALLQAVDSYRMRVATGGLPAGWVSGDLYENLRDYVKELEHG